MEIFVSIDGVLRDLVQKFEYHYKDNYLLVDAATEETATEVYHINYPINNDNFSESFGFNSVEEYEYFKYIEYPLEIYGHAGLSYATAVSDLNNLIYNNKDHNFTVVGLDELGKAKPSTLFFLAKNGFMGNNIKFVRKEDVNGLWKKCDLWVTDSYEIAQMKPKNKRCVVFQTRYNENKKIRKHVTKIKDIKDLEL